MLTRIAGKSNLCLHFPGGYSMSVAVLNNVCVAVLTGGAGIGFISVLGAGSSGGGY